MEEVKFTKPPRRQPKLIQAPKIREVYYCEFWQDAQLPEFWKIRPVIIISGPRELFGSVTVIPVTSSPHPGNKLTFCLTTPIGKYEQSWAVCNYPVTVAVSRLSPVKNVTPRIEQAELEEIFLRLKRWIPLA